MKLDRNANADGTGKYALVKMRKLLLLESRKDYSATSSVEALHMRGVVDYGDSPETEFFVIRLKDKYAAPALAAYALAAKVDDPEYADEIQHLASKAFCHPHMRKPD